jgi:tape measure domain-containing protein
LSVALTAPIVAIGTLSVRSAVSLDSLKRGLTAITGSSTEAAQQLARLTEIAKAPGIGFQEAIQGSIRLQAVGQSAAVAEKALKEFSNAVALTGGGRAELERITVQLGQLSSKGKVLSQDLRPIIEAGPAVGRALKEAFGSVNAEDIQALGLSSEQFLARLIEQLEKLPRAGAGARNTFENFSDALFRASASIGEAILPTLTRLVETIEPIISNVARAIAQLSPTSQTLIVAFAA